MNKKPTVFLAVLLLLLAVAFVWLLPRENDRENIKPSDAQAAHSHDHVDHVLSNAEASKLSPRTWTPPAAFKEIGNPTPQIPYARGENARRYYESPKTQEVAVELSDREPTVLAKTPEDGRLYLLPEEIDLHTLIARRMVFDSTALDNIIAGNTSNLLAPTTGDEVLTIHIQSVKTRSAQSYTLKGRVKGELETSDVQLVYHDGVIHGTVARYSTGQHLEYRILADGHMMVRELNSSTMNSGCGNGEDTESDALQDGAIIDEVQIIPQSEPEVSEITAGWTTVDVVVGYDRGARVVDGGYSQIEARIIASVDRMTTAFGNSAVSNTEMMLLGTIEDPDYVFGGTDPGSMSGELNDLNNSSNTRLDTVSDYATQLGADFTSFILKQDDGSAGLASRPGNGSIVARDYMVSNKITFAHELGHNLGCTHGWGDSSQSYHSNYGWRLDPPSTVAVRTIMAYDWAWGSGDRIPYYSNPDILFNGAKTGAVDGYDVTGDATADARYKVGGLGYTGSNTTLSGFDGTHSTLGATNAYTIKVGDSLDSRYGATYASNRKTRVAAAIITPAAAANLSAGYTYELFFIGGDSSDVANIDLYKGGVFHSTLATGINPATDRYFSWTLDEGILTGSDYKIRVTLNPAAGATLIESGNFTITALPANFVEVVRPNGTEDFSIGTSQEITWVTNVTGNLKIELLKNGSPLTVLSASEPDDGSFTWNVPATLDLASDYRIKISSVNTPAYADTSDANFSISAPAGLTGIPYAESFDTDYGVWTQSLNSDIDWTRQTGTTSSSNTGPPGANTGTHYLYTEATGNFNKVAEITSWFDLSSVANAELTFYYNMYGTNMGTLEVRASTDGVNWTTINTLSGNKGTAWLQASVDLSAYAGTYVQLSFKGTTGANFASDMAIDDVAINEVVTAYGTWSGGLAYNVDSNGDGIDNGVAWVLGAADPSTNARSLLPVIDNTTDPTYFKYTYRRSDTANANANKISFEYSSDLTTWTEALSSANIIITEIDDDYGTGIDKVEVKINRTLAVGQKLFGHLRVDIGP